MNKVGVVVSGDGGPIRGSNISTRAVDSDYPVPKIRPDLYAVEPYTFTSEPGTGTVEMLNIPHPFNDRVPFGFVMINESNGEEYTPLTEYFILYSLEEVFVFPAFETAEISQKISAEMSNTGIRIWYEAFKNIDPGFPSPPDYEAMNGRTFNFKYYIFIASKDDTDVENVFVTI
jgi:hypothetical protein